MGFNEKGELANANFDEEGLNEEDSESNELEMSEITKKGGSNKVRDHSGLDSLDTNIEL